MLKINCDLGEGVPLESLLIPLVDEVNIACGGHAGSLKDILKVMLLANVSNVKVGAHPSYIDRENFGRKEHNLSYQQLKSQIDQQMDLFNLCCEDSQTAIHHIKLHGALYNQAARDPQIAESIVRIFEGYLLKGVPLVVPPNAILRSMLEERQFNFLLEGFLDRAYEDDGSLVARTQPSAIIADSDEIIGRYESLSTKKELKTKSGKTIPLNVDTVCIHGDHSHTLDILKKLRQRHPKLTSSL
ncbi:MAG: LamB/YcsF family protein [Cyclobacteriaceae bacterium]|nr:LamB/YcsF family protein [Cyclobacteriaceae bacterium]MCH8516658.1 LamB/YcsF family protein [Cyclobacteriaceae bacterium]